MSEQKYYPEINGLRAIAVLIVIFFHAFPEYLTGGFVGVDVFFVISGYLITQIIINDLKQDKFSIFVFYQKRIRRIFPALLVVLSVLLFCGWFLLSSVEYDLLGKHLLSTLGFFSNFTFLKEIGYFDVSSSQKILLHMWSLAIEEQFYLLWPFTLVIFWKLRKQLLFLFIIILFIISLGFSIHHTPQSQSEAFYWPWTRFWELLLGALITIPISKNLTLDSVFKKSWISEAISVIALLFILVPAFYYNEVQEFPGWRALFPTLGAGFIIMVRGSSWINRKLLANRLIVFIGLISYPLYLWHWPLLALFNILVPKQFDQREVTISMLLVLTFILSFLTYRYIESPVREATKKSDTLRKTAGILFALAILLAGLSYAVPLWRNKEEIRAGRHNFEEALKGPEAEQCKNILINKICTSPVDRQYVSEAECRDRYTRLGMCAVTDANREPSIAVVGDSHAAHYFPGLSEHYSKQNENVLLLALSSVAPFYATENISEESRSAAPLLEYAVKSATIKKIILSGFWNAYYTNEKVIHKKLWIRSIFQKDYSNQNEVFLSGLDKTLEILDQSGKEIILILDVPFIDYFNSCVPRFLKFEAACNLSTFEYESTQGKYRAVIFGLQQKYKNLKIFDPYSELILDKHFQPFIDGEFIYGDTQHLSILGSRLIIRKAYKY